MGAEMSRPDLSDVVRLTWTGRQREIASNQLSNNRHHQRWTPADADGRSFAGQAHCLAGSSHRNLASGRRGRLDLLASGNHRRQ